MNASVLSSIDHLMSSSSDESPSKHILKNLVIVEFIIVIPLKLFFPSYSKEILSNKESLSSKLIFSYTLNFLPLLSLTSILIAPSFIYYYATSNVTNASVPSSTDLRDISTIIMSPSLYAVFVTTAFSILIP